jgi:hypothetical protein
VRDDVHIDAVRSEKLRCVRNGVHGHDAELSNGRLLALGLDA